jgi:hypothetical protein
MSKPTFEYHLGFDGVPFLRVSSEEFMGAWQQLKECGKDAEQFEGVRFLIVEGTDCGESEPPKRSRRRRSTQN